MTDDSETIKIENPTVLDRWYGRIVGESDARAHKGISAEAARHVPRNFLRYLLAHICTKTADELTSAKTVLPWLFALVGAPVAMTAWLVPIRESLSMLPQMFMTNLVGAWARRKWVWVAGGMIQAIAVVGMAAAVLLEGRTAGLAILGCLVIFSLARCLTSVTGKDVLGKTVPRERRGRLNGLSTGLAGIIVCLFGLAAALEGDFMGGGPNERMPLLVLILLAAGARVVAVVVFAGIREEAGNPGKAERPNAMAKAARLWKSDPTFRRFVTARALMLCSALGAPFYILIGSEATGNGAGLLGAFILAGGIATGISAPIWGRRADRSSRGVLIEASIITAATGILLAILVLSGTAIADWRWSYPLAYFVLSIGHAGVRVGRQTYVVDIAEGDKRTEYVAVSNTIIGMVLLASGLLSALALVVGPIWFILLLSIVGLIGAAVARCLPEATPS